MNILQAVAQAGGTTEFASKGSVVLIRRGKDGKETRYRVDLDRAVDGDDGVVTLKAGDTIYVP
jgi:protein involved in polysaccharide export with SLBB domain